eukprot:13603321-Ditylum_brightwellii.AAC.1
MIDIVGRYDGAHHHDAEGGDPSIQLLGLLAHIVCDDYNLFSNGAGKMTATADTTTSCLKKKDRDDSAVGATEKKTTKENNATIAAVSSGSANANNAPTSSEQPQHSTNKRKRSSSGSGITSLSSSPKHSSSKAIPPMTATSFVKKMLDTANTSKESLLLHQERNWSIESFVASGGLRWATRSIVKLISALLHGTATIASASSGVTTTSHEDNEKNEDRCSLDSSAPYSMHQHTQQQHRVRMDDVMMEALQVRIVLFVDFVYRLVLYASIPSLSSSISSSSSSGGKRESSSSNTAELRLGESSRTSS